MKTDAVKKVVIAGGGTAGWIAAATLSKAFGHKLEICLIESDDIPTVGVGEATIPPLLSLHKILELDEREFLASVKGTFKLGIQFENWREQGDQYIHSFGWAGKDSYACGFVNFWLAGLRQGINIPYGDYCVEHLAARLNKFAILPSANLNYAYHFDAGCYAKLLRTHSEKRGVQRIEGKIAQVNTHVHNGFIKELVLESGNVVNGDLFIDCTGFRALLIEQTLHTGFIDWSHWLPCDRAVAVQTEAVGEPIPYTRAIAHEAGWRWRIPLQHRVGNGLVYCSRYLTDEQATEKLLNSIEGEPLNTPRVIQFRTGTRTKHWNKNCVALGLASGFLEPLESTSIHMIQRSVLRLLQLFPSEEILQDSVDEFNAQTSLEVERIRDFIILHYCVTERNDSAFWQHCRTMELPESLRRRIELFKKTGRVFKGDSELFGEESWIQVMLGQGIVPAAHHPFADAMPSGELASFLAKIRESTRNRVGQLPLHADFIAHYCAVQK
ncbi:tryptophan halogenase family protein [Cellvibrio sp. OA-2007]|uniref:tryptophan halogenase family protein n=1 Tax=Cellvibrio sp. OA-2007 TaxID=529823 RepID=UPI0007807088|nr:tryptophan halogenase family protein [Cellvibrio sp. OA-2007]